MRWWHFIVTALSLWCLEAHTSATASSVNTTTTSTTPLPLPPLPPLPPPPLQLPMARLYNDFIAPFNYVIRPVKDQRKATKINIMFNFIQLLEVNEIGSTISIDMWMAVWWHDDFRQWNPDDYQGIDYIAVSNTEVWRPTFVATNSNDQRYLYESTKSPVYITSNGTSHWHPGSPISFSCVMDLTKYPFDQQECVLKLLATDLSGEVDVVIMEYDGLDDEDRLLSTEWDVYNFKFYSWPDDRSGVAGRHYTKFKYRLFLRRKWGFFVLNTILPVNFLSLLSLIAFIIPDDSGEKISYSVTLLLATGIYLSTVTASLPPLSENMPYIVLYFLALYVWCGMTLIAVVSTLYCKRRNCVIQETENVNDSGGKGGRTIGSKTATSTRQNYRNDGGYRRETVKANNQETGDDSRELQQSCRPCHIDVTMLLCFFGVWVMITLVFFSLVLQ